MPRIRPASPGAPKRIVLLGRELVVARSSVRLRSGDFRDFYERKATESDRVKNGIKLAWHQSNMVRQVPADAVRDDDSQQNNVSVKRRSGDDGGGR